MSRYIVCAIALLFSVPAPAQDGMDPEKMAYCMYAHANASDVAAMKDLIVTALQNDVEGMRTGVAELGAAMAKLAMNNCGARLRDLEDPAFEVAGEKFGELVAAKIMTEAFAKLE